MYPSPNGIAGRPIDLNVVINVFLPFHHVLTANAFKKFFRDCTLFFELFEEQVEGEQRVKESRSSLTSFVDRVMRVADDFASWQLYRGSHLEFYTCLESCCL